MTVDKTIEVVKQKNTTLNTIRSIIFKPLLFIAIFTAMHLLFKFITPYFKPYPSFLSKMDTVEVYVFFASLISCCYWLVARALNKGTDLMANSELFSKYLSLKILFPFFSSVIKIVFCLVLVNFLVQYVAVSKVVTYYFNKASSVIIIAALTWILVKLVDVVGALLLHHYNSMDTSTSTTRKICTQILIIKRLVIGLVILLAAGSALMLFDSVRALGASVLTTAGIAGLVITFAAQRSLGSIFAGLEIALTQPIKIGDLIMIENEFGTVEEINFRSVIIKLWDLRRLSVPTNYFLEKPFQNWSRQESNNLIGSVILYVDFTLPISKIRKKIEEILKSSPLWDGKTGKVQVNDLREQVMQLRILASAKNADDMSSLRNEIREKVIDYIVQNYPECLPNTRTSSIEQAIKQTFEEENKLVHEMV